MNEDMFSIYAGKAITNESRTQTRVQKKKKIYIFSIFQTFNLPV